MLSLGAPFAAAGVCAGLLCAALLGAERPAGTPVGPLQDGGVRKQAPQSPDDPRLAATCGGCHAVPPPEILPQHIWRDEFIQMMFIREGRTPPPGARTRGALPPSIALPPDMDALLPFYTARAPDRLPAPDQWPAAGASPVSFSRHGLSLPGMPNAPAISSVRLADLDGDSRLDILGTDMRQGVVFAGPPAQGAALAEIATIPYPGRVTQGDIDGDGRQDLLVSEMGAFFPADHDKGAVIWLRGVAGGKYSAFWLDGWPRVSDIQSGDFNGDGRRDLLVSAFGWRKTGRLAILENKPASGPQTPFTEHTIDPRSGALQAIPVDLNGDGRLDFVTVLAQEHELVLAYISKGAGGFAFEQKVIYAAPHPNWGSSGIDLADIDRDGDLDIILSHGDTFDDGIVKPYHGIQLLENQGTYPFKAHTLAQMPGVHGIRTADLDGDGDLDIVAGALLAGGADVDESTLPALVWLEQTKPRTFTRHTIAMGFPRYAALDVGDVDQDGDVDIVTGWFSMHKPAPAWVEVWVNQKKP